MVVSREELYRRDPGMLRRGAGIALLIWAVINVVVAALVAFGVFDTLVPMSKRLTTCVGSFITSALLLAWGSSARRWWRMAREYDGLVGEGGTDIAAISARKDVSPFEVLEDLKKLSKRGFLPDCDIDFESGAVSRHPRSA